MTNELNDVHLLTVPEAAKFLRIGRNLAYELVARGDIPAVRLGRVIRVPRAGLEQWLELQSVSDERQKHGRPSGEGMLGRAPVR